MSYYHMEQRVMPEWITQLLSGAGALGAGLAGAWALWRNGRRSAEDRLRADLFAETRALRGEIDVLRQAHEVERAAREAESARHSAQLVEAEQERRKMMLSQSSLQQTVSDSRTQISRLTSIFAAIDAAARRLYPTEWRTILVEATGGPDLTPLIVLEPDPPAGKGEP